MQWSKQGHYCDEVNIKLDCLSISWQKMKAKQHVTQTGKCIVMYLGRRENSFYLSSLQQGYVWNSFRKIYLFKKQQQKLIRIWCHERCIKSLAWL